MDSNENEKISEKKLDTTAPQTEKESYNFIYEKDKEN